MPLRARLQQRHTPRTRAAPIRLQARRSAIRAPRAQHPAHAEPTLGTLVGEQFWYVANAQWDRFAKGVAAPEAVPPVILKLPLPGLKGESR